MTKHLLPASIVGVAIILAAWLHAASNARPVASFPLNAVFYQNSGIEIKVPDPAHTTVDIYNAFALIKRPDGVWTVIPMDRIHAMDVRGTTLHGIAVHGTAQHVTEARETNVRESDVGEAAKPAAPAATKP